MTSKLTITDDKLSALLSEMERSFTGCQGHGYIDAAEEYTDMISALRELQERRKAEKDSEPVAWTDEEELRDVNVAGIGYLFGIDQEANKFADPRRQIMLYRHAQPAPVVPEEKPMPNPLSMYAIDAVASIAEAKGWNACRAAMLQAGNSPVIPDGYRLQPISEYEAMCATVNSDEWPQRWIPVSEQMPEVGDIVLTAMGGVVNVGETECSAANCRFFTSVISGRELPATHWMPLPAAPQEVKGE
ncbi:TPA: DUF551 domain-containing protein [Raoultella ornithinolytica]